MAAKKKAAKMKAPAGRTKKIQVMVTAEDAARIDAKRGIVSESTWAYEAIRQRLNREE